MEEHKAPRPEEPPSGRPARDLVEAARNGTLTPLIGRERELERITHILCRRTKNNAVLIGEAGTGKTAIVNGLALRIASADVPLALSDRRLIAIDASSLTAPGQRSRELQPLFETPNPILFVRGLFNLAAAGSAWAVVEAMHALEPHLASGSIQCIATGSPAGLRETINKAGMLARHFEPVQVAPVSDAEAVRIVSALKKQFGQFHDVTFGEGAVEMAVAASARFLPDRHLPDRAIDLIDEAAAAVRLRCESEPREIAGVVKAIRHHAQATQNAIAKHDFGKARQHSDEEQKLRAELERLRAEDRGAGASSASNIVTPEDIEAAIAIRTGVPVDAVRRVLARKGTGNLERIAGLLAAQLPAETHAWLPFLASYLARCSPAEAAALAELLRQAGLGDDAR